MFSVLVGFVLSVSGNGFLPISYDTIPSKSHLALPEVLIKGNAMVAKRRGDTLIFSADTYKRPDAIRLEQLFSHIPGFQVDASGRISFNGKEINKIMLDGDDLTAENYQMLSRNLRSIMIDSIQVLEKYNENRFLNHQKHNQDVAVNLVLKKSFYGKTSYNVLFALAQIKYGEFQKELIHLRKNTKHLAFFNSNNIGAKSIHTQMVNHASSLLRYEPLHQSWPGELRNEQLTELPPVYVNQNGDWGLQFATSFKTKGFNSFRINFNKGNEHNFTTTNSRQFYMPSVTDTFSLFSLTEQKLQNTKTAFTFIWEKDKKGNSKSNYTVDFYDNHQLLNLVENRKITTAASLFSLSQLSTRGIKIGFEKSWLLPTKQIWLWEVYAHASGNRYSTSMSGNVQVDSLANETLQLIFHNNYNIHQGVGTTYKKGNANIQLWFRSSFSSILSKNNMQQVNWSMVKNYFFTQVHSPVARNIDFNIQAMVGASNWMNNSEKKAGIIYHLDHAFVWKQNARHQLTINYGVLRNATDITRFFAGNVMKQGALYQRGPAHPVFPVSMYIQFSFSGMDLYRGFNYGGHLLMKQVTGEYLHGIEIFPTYTQLVQFISKRQLFISSNVHLEKVIFPLRMRYRLSLNSLFVQQPIQFNAVQFLSTSSTFRIGNSVSTNWRKWLNFQFEYWCILSRFENASTTSSLWNYRNNYKLQSQYQLGRKWNFSWTIQCYTGKGVVQLNLLDCKFNISPLSKSRFYLQGNNLFNTRKFRYQVLSATGSGVFTEQLIGRRIILGVDIPL